MSSLPWRIIFFGTPAFAVPALESLMNGPDDVVAVVTQPDREQGRGRKPAPSAVKEAALRHRLALFQPEKIRGEAFWRQLESLRPDLFVVAAYGRILPGTVLDVPSHGAVNVHASILPRYRGAAPIAWAILRGEKTTGVTTMLMDEGMDTGDILLQEEVPIEADETAEGLRDKLAVLGAALLTKTLAKMKTGDLRPVPQDPSRATDAPVLKKEDGRIDWSKTAEEIGRQVRAFHPWPGAFTAFQGHRVKIQRGEAREGRRKDEAGTVVWTGADFIEVATGRGSYLIKEIQPEGKKRMTMREYLSGHAISVGTVFG